MPSLGKDFARPQAFMKEDAHCWLAVAVRHPVAPTVRRLRAKRSVYVTFSEPARTAGDGGDDCCQEVYGDGWRFLARGARCVDERAGRQECLPQRETRF